MGSRSACWSITRRAASGLRWGHSEHPAPGFCRRKTNTGQIPTKIQIHDKYTTLGSPGSTNMQRYDDPHLTTSGSWMLPTHTAGKSRRRCAPVEWSVATDETIGSKQRWSKKQKQDWEQTGAKTKSRLGAAGAGLSTRCHDKESNSHKTWKDMKCEHLTTTQEWAKLKRKRGATQEIFWFPNPLAVQSQMGTLSTQEQAQERGNVNWMQ